MNNTNDENNQNDLKDKVENNEADSAENSAPSGQQQGEDNDKKNDEKDDTKSLAKQIAKMRKRIDAEAGQKHDYKNQLEESQKQVKTLTQKLADLTGDKNAKDVDHEALTKAQKENASLKAQLARIDQISKVRTQFAEAGVQVPQNVLNIVVPSGADEKQISENMNALSEFYDTIVADTKKGFLSAKTPRVTGSDSKPISRKDIAKIKDPVKRINFIKSHLQELK